MISIRKFIICIIIAIIICPALISESKPKIIHVYVALCDNESQGIVPVPAHLGNGDDPERNLYWGAAYGVKTFFSKQKEWELVRSMRKPRDGILERIVFRHKKSGSYMIADGYRGSKITSAGADFLLSVCGENRGDIKIKGADGVEKKISIGSDADLIAYIGHNWLMDDPFAIPGMKKGNELKEVIILACASRLFFENPLRTAGAKPLLWTNGLMAPEAYTLAAALESWLDGKTDEEILEAAASAYAKYQNIKLSSAKRLFTTGY